MEKSILSNIIENNNLNIIEYDTPFNNKFRPISNKQITTVEISPTGSGKNRAYENEPNTLMLMPSNSMVVQNNGLLSKDKASEYETNTKKYRTQWHQIDNSKCDYMTYDKFYGHVVKGNEFVANMNIIIDEAHILFASDREEYQELVKALLNREVEYRELKLISATLRVETLALFTKHKFDVNIYQKKDFAPHIHFVNEFPKVNPDERTLIFINSTDKMYQIEGYLKNKYSDIKTIVMKSKDKLPSKKEIEECNVILSTSVIRQGYSIENEINKVIIHNVNNPEGAIGILQYMARPRNQSPEVYVVKASTHFDMSKKPEGRDELLLREDIFEIIKKQKEFSNTTTLEGNAIALCVEEWAKKVRQSNYNNNPVLSSYLFEKAMKNIELYMTDGENMKLSINSFLPNATIDIVNKLKEKEDIKFDRLNIKEYTNELAKLRSMENVKNKISEMIENIKNDTTIKDEEKKRLENRLTKISEVEPYRDFRMNGTPYRYTDKIIVKQMIDEHTFNRCKWHQFNIDNNIYQLVKVLIQSTRRLKPNDELKISKIDNKFKKFIKPLELSKTAKYIKILERLYSFNFLDKDKKLIELGNRSKKREYVKITSLYPIEDCWFFISNK